MIPVAAELSTGATDAQRSIVLPEQALLSYYAQAAGAPDLDALVAAFSQIAELYGYGRGALVSLATPGRAVQPRTVFGWNLSAWSCHYAERRHERFDPAIQAVFRSVQPVTWAELSLATDARGRRVFDEASEFGGRDGLIVPVHGPLGEVMCVSLVADRPIAPSAQVRANLQVAATIFAVRGLHLAELLTEADDGGVELSRRERQCAYWVSRGKTDWEMGLILGISEATVAYHLQNAKRKLGVRLRSQLPTEAWRRGVLLDGRG